MVQVKTRSNTTDVTDIPFDDDHGPTFCAWPNGVCTDERTHFIKSKSEPIPELFCGRHYALTIAHYLEVHRFECDGPASAHFEKFGKL